MCFFFVISFCLCSAHTVYLSILLQWLVATEKIVSFVAFQCSCCLCIDDYLLVAMEILLCVDCNLAGKSMGSVNFKMWICSLNMAASIPKYCNIIYLKWRTLDDESDGQRGPFILSVLSKYDGFEAFVWSNSDCVCAIETENNICMNSRWWLTFVFSSPKKPRSLIDLICCLPAERKTFQCNVFWWSDWLLMYVV